MNYYELFCYLLVIGGGSTTVEGPKNDGISLDVVTGVFKSPVCDSDEGAWLLCCSSLFCVELSDEFDLPTLPTLLVVKRLR